MNFHRRIWAFLVLFIKTILKWKVRKKTPRITQEFTCKSIVSNSKPTTSIEIVDFFNFYQFPWFYSKMPNSTSSNSQWNRLQTYLRIYQPSKWAVKPLVSPNSSRSKIFPKMQIWCWQTPKFHNFTNFFELQNLHIRIPHKISYRYVGHRIASKFLKHSGNQFCNSTPNLEFMLQTNRSTKHTPVFL